MRYFYRPYQMGSVSSIVKKTVKTVTNPIEPIRLSYKTTKTSLSPSLLTTNPINATTAAVNTAISVAETAVDADKAKARIAQNLEELKKQEAMKRHAELVRQANSASAAKAAESAGRASAQEAQYAAEQRAIASARGAAKASQQASEAVSKKVQIANLRRTTDNINANLATQKAKEIAEQDPGTADDLVNAGVMSQNAAANDREAQEIAIYMPQNDYTKWILIGGGALLLIMLLKRGKK